MRNKLLVRTSVGSLMCRKFKLCIIDGCAVYPTELRFNKGIGWHTYNSKIRLSNTTPHPSGTVLALTPYISGLFTVRMYTQYPPAFSTPGTGRYSVLSALFFQVLAGAQQFFVSSTPRTRVLSHFQPYVLQVLSLSK